MKKAILEITADDGKRGINTIDSKDNSLA
jgi:hypothetical protein